MLYNTFAFLYIESCRRIFTPLPPSLPHPHPEKLTAKKHARISSDRFTKKKKGINSFFFSFTFLFTSEFWTFHFFSVRKYFTFRTSYHCSRFREKNFLSNYLIYILIGRQTRWSNWFGLITNEIHERSAASRLFSSEWRVESPLVKWVIE